SRKPGVRMRHSGSGLLPSAFYLLPSAFCLLPSASCVTLEPMRKPTSLALLCLVAPMTQAANLPRPGSDFAINLAPGKQLQLSQYQGHPVVLAFILTYCSHCQKSIGFLIKD